MIDLLIPFTDLDFLVWGGLASSLVGWQVHRKKTPFLAKVEYSRGDQSVDLVIERRAGVEWPPNALEYLKNNCGGGDPARWASKYRVSVKQIDTNGPDADEQVIQAAVEVKGLIEDWSNPTDQVTQLAKMAKASLKGKSINKRARKLLRS